MARIILTGGLKLMNIWGVALKIFPVLLILILLTSCNTYFAEPLINKTQADQLRIHTFNNCKDLLNKKITVSGTVMYEQCNKNCLGGCANSGPYYCYYGIKDEKDCLFFYPSKVTSLGNTQYVPEKIYHELKFGQKVAIRATPRLYASPYCGGYSDPINHTECVYFEIE